MKNAEASSTAPKLIAAVLIGLVLGALPLPICFVFSGGGEGTGLAFALFYGPILPVISAMEPPHVLAPGVLLGLFVIYVVFLAVGRMKGFGRMAWVIIATVHILSIGILVWTGNDWTDDSDHVLWRRPELTTILLFLLMLYPIGSLCYACSWPRRPFSVRTLLLIMAGCVVLLSASVTISHYFAVVPEQGHEEDQVLEERI